MNQTEFTYLKIDFVYNERNHDGYCSDAEEDEDSAQTYRVTMISGNPIEYVDDSFDVQTLYITEKNITDASVLKQLNFEWKNCIGSGYCDVDSERIATKIEIIKKEITDTDIKDNATITPQGFKYDFESLSFWESRVRVIQMLRDKFADPQNQDDVRINEIINKIELHLIYGFDYKLSLLLNDCELLVKYLWPALRKIVSTIEKDSVVCDAAKAMTQSDD